MIAIAIVLQFWTGSPVKPPTLHEGFWLTCGGAERVLEHRVLGKHQWELHLGPRDEFALYVNEVDGEHDHDDPNNLLAPAFRVRDVVTWRGKRQWNIPKLRLWISIAESGASDNDCESFYVKIDKIF